MLFLHLAEPQRGLPNVVMININNKIMYSLLWDTSHLFTKCPTQSEEGEFKGDILSFLEQVRIGLC